MSCPEPPDREALWDRLALAFVALGVLLRVGRYALNSPLWWNEAFVAVNFLKRGYLDLLRPLDYGQVCPLLFLWAEKAVIDLLGFSEPTLRLVPLLGGLGALVLFHRVAGMVLPPLPRMLAVAVLAVSYHPIRLGAEVKPYATDLLAALALIGLGLAWSRDRRRVGRLWALAAVAPLTLGASHPAAFAAGGVWLGLARDAWISGDRRARFAHAAFGLTTVASFGLWYRLYARAQGLATLEGMRAYWADAFPPLDHAGRLIAWLFRAHAGRLLAYPGGGDGGASLVTLLLVALGIGVLVRRREAPALGVLLLPFGLTLLAAALRRHPYGGHPRVAQHLAPAACLLAGAGLAGLFGRIGSLGRRGRAVGLALMGLAAVGLVPLAADAGRPYRDEVEHDAREFARRFWSEQARGAEVACLRGDLDIAPWESIDLDTALYLCNRRIYGPRQPRFDRVGPGRPLRVVHYDSDRDPAPSPVAWLGAMTPRYRLVGRTTHAIGGPRGARGRATVFEFIPTEAPGTGPVAGLQSGLSARR